MKKFAIGCGIVLVVLVVLCGVGLYFAWDPIIKPIVRVASSMAALVKTGEEMRRIESQVRNTTAFTPPANGELTEELTARFVKAQSQIQSKLGPRMEQLTAAYERFDKALIGANRDAALKDAMGALGDLTSVMMEAKKAQVEALNETGFSLKEYAWVRSRVYAAVDVVAGAFDVTRLAAQAKGARVEGPPGFDSPQVLDVPEKNQALVAPYAKQLKGWAALAYFGF